MVISFILPQHIENLIQTAKDGFYNGYYKIWKVDKSTRLLLTTFNHSGDKLVAFLWETNYDITPKIFTYPVKWNKNGSNKYPASPVWRQIEPHIFKLSSICSSNCYLLFLDTGRIEEFVLEDGVEYFTPFPCINEKNYYMRILPH